LRCAAPGARRGDGNDSLRLLSFKSRTFRVYDAPNADAIRTVAQSNGLPVDQITEVRVLDPCFYF